MKPRTFFRLMGQGIGNLWRHRFMGLASLTITSLTLVLMGVFLVFIANMTNVAHALEERVQMRVFLQDGLTLVQEKEVGEKIRQMEGVRQVIFVDKEQALADLKRQLGDREDLFAIVTTNPLPDSYKLKLERGVNWGRLAALLRQIPGVEEVTYGEAIVRRALAFSRMISLVTAVAALLLAGATVLIVMNTIRLTVYARRREIEIMRLVGASDAYIRFPFVVEGITLGFLGALVGGVVVDRAYLWAGQRLVQAMPFIPWIGRDALWLEIIVALMLLGVFIGAMGSYLSVKRYLRV